MKKAVSMKLMAMALLLLVSIVTVVSASFAWFTLSENPMVSGIQVSLSGGNTILIAPDLSTTVDGVTYHYPGEFSNTLNFNQYSSYDYLNQLGGLSPVSTVDGLHWFLATYFDKDDPMVQAGLVSPGDLRPVQEFRLDNTLGFANQPADSQQVMMGHYIYMDFWVVSPGSNYELRISTSEDGGSFVIDLLDPMESSETLSGFTLNNTGITSTSTSVRVGFLATTQAVTDLSMLYYQQTPGYNNHYQSLRGVYAEQGYAVADPQLYQFMIYEPNANAHPGGKVEDGAYVATYPLALFNGVAVPTNVLDRTSVQLTNWWSQAVNGSDLLLEQVFQTALMGKQDPQAAADSFYTNYLQGQFTGLVNQGSFIRTSAALSDFVSPERLQTLQQAGATDDVYIVKLQRNTPQRIRMYVWLEGQDTDWDPSTAGNRFAVSIEFAGSNQ